uniref:Baculoviral IAP repeat-containing protein 2 n=1 Tax=Stichopus japonicus TaxID=307972 RepID=A0A077EKZ9_STIJA|nr:baculoviral IAP repeat-containing protein 2 [Apostichopus japonicus]
MPRVSIMPEFLKLKMLLLKYQQAESIVAEWPAEMIDHRLREMAQEIKIFPNKKQLKKKLARENNVTFHDEKPVTVISQGTNSRESVIFIHTMFKESERYLSFFTHKWPPTAPVTASVLAKAGFYYFGVSDTVQCFSCNGRINNWSPGDTAMGEHKRIYPRCKFVKGIDTRNVPARGLLDESTKQSTEGRKSLKSGKSSASQDEAGCSDEHLSELLQPLNLEESEPPSEAKSYFMKEINRLLSFKIWPISSHVDRFDLAAAGFYCVNESNGTVQCFACFGRLSEWKAGDRPKSEHLRLFPSCPFIWGRPTGNVPLTPTEKDQAVRFFSSSSSRLSRPLQIASNLSQSERYGLQGQSSTSHGSSVNLRRSARLPEPADLTVKYAKYPNNAYEQARLETYGRWPNDHSQIPANLARAGFFATGNGDEVKCFYCGGDSRTGASVTRPGKSMPDGSLDVSGYYSRGAQLLSMLCRGSLDPRVIHTLNPIWVYLVMKMQSYLRPRHQHGPLRAKSRPPQLRPSQNQDQRSKGKRKMKIKDKLGRSNQIKRNKERRINQLMKELKNYSSLTLFSLW